MGNPIYEDTDTGPFFEGFTDRGCGEHHTVGPHRAWCFDCGEWCYPDAPCGRCERSTDAKAAEDSQHLMADLQDATSQDQRIEYNTWLDKIEAGEHSPTLEEYVRWDQYDSNLFWRLSIGDIQNLLEDAIGRLEDAGLLRAEGDCGASGSPST